MIINRLQSRNLLKYASLTLEDLPGKGLIAVSGPNESGKSTVGETLCFALFGRTFALDMRDRTKLIKWGESRATVEVDFTAPDGARYRVERFIDDQGTHGARLARADDDATVAQGEDKVATAVAELLGYDFDSFIESFYLAQREITSPHAHSRAVKSIAGIAPFEDVAEQLRAADAESTHAVARMQAHRDETDAALAELDFDEERLARLKETRAEAQRLGGALNDTAATLEGAGNDYRDGKQRLAAAAATRSSARIWAWLFLLIGAAAGALWGMLVFQAGHSLTLHLVASLDELWPQWHALIDPWLPVIAGAGALLFLVFAIRGAGANGRRRQAAAELDATVARLAPLFDDEQGERADAVLADAREQSEQYEYSYTDEEQDEAEGETAEPGPEAPSAAGDDVPAALPQPRFTAGALERYEVVPSELAAAVEARVAALCARRDALARSGAWLDEAIAGEEATLAEARRLQGMLEDFDRQLAQEQHRGRVREMARELLASASRHLSARFNHNIRNAAGHILPLFTEGRYQHVKIDPSLTVQVFSSEKGDFMELDEISSGTQRQIMLALRLALAQELIDQTGMKPQFLFLDEPFAFFDKARTESSIAALPKLSDDLPQIWVTSQEFPDAAAFDRHVRCERGGEGLSA